MAIDLAYTPLSLFIPCASATTSTSSCSVSNKAALTNAISSSAPPRSSSFLPSSSIALGLLASSSSASSLSYDDVALPGPPPTPAPPLALDFDFNALADSVTDFVFSNPVAVFAGVAAVGLPLLVSALLAQPKSWGSVSARDAFRKLKDQEGVLELLDIRSGIAVKAEGTPDLRAFRKRVFQIPYTGEDEAYLKKLLAKFKDPPNTTLFILDEYAGKSSSLAKLLAKGGFKAAYAIKDGAEGPNGWRKNELPWLLPRKGFLPDVSGLKSVVDTALGENPNLVPATLGVAAAAGVGLVVFSEAETALQILGSAALIQLFVKKFLFAEDRQKTLKELQNFLDTKIAPKEIVDELKGIGQVLLPKYEEVPTVDSTNGAVTFEGGQDTSAEQSEEKQIKVAASTLVDPPKSLTASSPYTQFPDLKPPASPTPS